MKKLLLILALSFLLRIFNLSAVPSGLYWDELDVGYQARSLIETGRDYFNQAIPLFPHSFAEYRTPLVIYSTTPSVLFFGMSANSIRFPSAIWGTIGVLAIYLLAKQIYPKAAIWSSLLMALNPWSFTYSRIGFEVIILSTLATLVLVLLFKSFKNPKFLPAFFAISGLTLYSYSTAKLFIPAFLVFLAIYSRNYWLKLPKLLIIKSLIIFSIFATPLYLDSLFGNNSNRFLNVSILTDPVAADLVNIQRLESAQSRISGPAQVGLSPLVYEKILYNKPQNMFNQFMGNYLSAFSTDFLFIKGDPQIRHSPNKDWFGQFYFVEFITIFSGMFMLLRSKAQSKKIFVTWILLAPVAAALTRDGAMHASRLVLLLPALILVSAIGLENLAKKSKLIFSGVLGLFIFSSFTFMGFYFTRYKLESAQYFDFGFIEAMQIAKENASKYDYVFVDVGANNSGLMSFIYTVLKPTEIQPLHPLHTTEISDGIHGYKFGNIVVTQAGTRHWTKANLPKNSLIITHFTQPLIETVSSPIQTILYPNKLPAFVVFSRL